MKIEKFIKALGNALREPGDHKKVMRLCRYIGHALVVESEANIAVRRQVHAAIRTSALTAAQIVKNGYPQALAPHLHVMRMVMDGFEGDVTPLNPKPLAETLLNVRKGSWATDTLFVLIGRTLAKIETIDDLNALMPARSVLATNASALELGDDSKKQLSLQIKVLLEIITTFENEQRERYCEWCEVRMKKYWLINMKPKPDTPVGRARLWYPAKICETCKSNPVLMALFYVDAEKAKPFS